MCAKGETRKEIRDERVSVRFHAPRCSRSASLHCTRGCLDSAKPHCCLPSVLDRHTGNPAVLAHSWPEHLAFPVVRFPLEPPPDLTDLQCETAAMHASHGRTTLKMPDGFLDVPIAEQLTIYRDVLSTRLRDLAIMDRRRFQARSAIGGSRSCRRTRATSTVMRRELGVRACQVRRRSRIVHERARRGVPLRALVPCAACQWRRGGNPP
jgi:hypothetical protein